MPDLRLDRLREAIVTIAEKAPELRAAMDAWALQTTENRMVPVLVLGSPPQVAVGTAWLDACNQDALVRKLAELAYQATHDLGEPPTQMDNPADRELWIIGISMITHVKLESRFPAASRDRRLIETIATLVTSATTSAAPDSIYEALKQNEPQVDVILDNG